VRCDGLELAAQSRSDLAAGQAVTLLIRPEKVAIHRADADDLPAASTILPGSVVDCVYRGAQTRYAVQLASSHKLIVDTQHAAQYQTFAPGDAVQVSWKPDDLSVLLE
jgi:ABC-type Fe3+/spermidine/putrescine transport system ATPase subunit